MFRLAALLLALIAVVLAFVATPWSWVPLAIGLGGLLMLYASARNRRIGPLAGLSPAANEMLGKFGHFYLYPAGSGDVSGAASGLQIGGFAVGVIAIFKASWVVLAFCVFVWFAAIFFGRQFNPTLFLIDDQERLAHAEVLAFIKARRTQLAEHDIEAEGLG